MFHHSTSSLIADNRSQPDSDDHGDSSGEPSPVDDPVNTAAGDAHNIFWEGRITKETPSKGHG